MEHFQFKQAGAEKLGVIIRIDTKLDKNTTTTSFPKKLEAAKNKLAKLKRK